MNVKDEEGRERSREAVHWEVVEPERLVVDESAGDARHKCGVTVVTSTHLDDDRTKMVFHATIGASEQMRRMRRVGSRPHATGSSFRDLGSRS